MKIYICRKSISDLKNPIIKQEYETACVSVGDFIKEMVEKNYRQKPVKELAKQLMRSHLKKDYASYLERTDILE